MWLPRCSSPRGVMQASSGQRCSISAWKTSNMARDLVHSRSMVTPSNASSPASSAARLRIGGVPARKRSMPGGGRVIVGEGEGRGMAHPAAQRG